MTVACGGSKAAKGWDSTIGSCISVFRLLFIQTNFQTAFTGPQGVWLNPPAVVHTLLNHPLIELHEHSPLTAVSHDGTQWTTHTPDAHFSASHIVYCMGAHSPTAADTNVSALPFRQSAGNRRNGGKRFFQTPALCPIRRKLHQPELAGATLLRRNLCPQQQRRRLAPARRNRQPRRPATTQPAIGAIIV